MPAWADRHPPTTNPEFPDLLTPPGDDPRPVYLTNHSRRHAANTAVRRGYIVCSYKAAQASEHRAESDDSEHWIDAYPDYDWGCLARWAWGAMRAIDYLHTLPQVDKTKIGLEGNSRYAKMSAIAAAFDERIGAVVPSRANFAGAIPYRYTTAMFGNERIDEATRYYPHWLAPRFRYFIGREHKLPIDQNLLLSLIAPRGLLISQAYTEHQGNPWAVEQTYRSLARVYAFANKPENLGLYQQPGEHGPTADDIEFYFDFFDRVFGRKSAAKTEMWVNGYTFQKWKTTTNPRIDVAKYRKRALGDFFLEGIPAL